MEDKNFRRDSAPPPLVLGSSPALTAHPTSSLSVRSNIIISARRAGSIVREDPVAQKDLSGLALTLLPPDLFGSSDTLLNLNISHNRFSELPSGLSRLRCHQPTCNGSRLSLVDARAILPIEQQADARNPHSAQPQLRFQPRRATTDRARKTIRVPPPKVTDSAMPCGTGGSIISAGS